MGLPNGHLLAASTRQNREIFTNRTTTFLEIWSKCPSLTAQLVRSNSFRQGEGGRTSQMIRSTSFGKQDAEPAAREGQIWDKSVFILQKSG